MCIANAILNDVCKSMETEVTTVEFTAEEWNLVNTMLMHLYNSLADREDFMTPLEVKVLDIVESAYGKVNNA